MKQRRAEETNIRRQDAHMGGFEYTHMSAREQVCCAVATNATRDLANGAESAHYCLPRGARFPGVKICLPRDDQLLAGVVSQTVDADPSVIFAFTVPANATQDSAVVITTGARSGSSSTTYMVHSPMFVVGPGVAPHTESSMNTCGVYASSWSSPRMTAGPASHFVDRCGGLLPLTPLGRPSGIH